MDYTEIRKKALRAFIGFLALTALVAALSVVTGDFGEIQLKVLATTLTISGASICSMACAAFIEKKRQVSLGLMGIGLSIVGGILMIIGVWPPIEDDVYWKLTITPVIWAVAFAHGFLLVLPTLVRRQKIVQPAAVICIALLAFLINFAAWTEMDNTAYYRGMALVAIAVALGTLVIPILAKMNAGERPKLAPLVLEQVSGQTYRDADGVLYEVHRVDRERGA